MMNKIGDLFKQQTNVAEHFDAIKTVSYTHLTLPTICSV